MMFWLFVGAWWAGWLQMPWWGWVIMVMVEGGREIYRSRSVRLRLHTLAYSLLDSHLASLERFVESAKDEAEEHLKSANVSSYIREKVRGAIGQILDEARVGF